MALRNNAAEGRGGRRLYCLYAEHVLCDSSCSRAELVTNAKQGRRPRGGGEQTQGLETRISRQQRNSATTRPSSSSSLTASCGRSPSQQSHWTYSMRSLFGPRLSSPFLPPLPSVSTRSGASHRSQDAPGRRSRPIDCSATRLECVCILIRSAHSRRCGKERSLTPAFPDKRHRASPWT